jgi:hypothetical protein
MNMLENAPLPRALYANGFMIASICTLSCIIFQCLMSAMSVPGIRGFACTISHSQHMTGFSFNFLFISFFSFNFFWRRREIAFYFLSSTKLGMPYILVIVSTKNRTLDIIFKDIIRPTPSFLTINLNDNAS